MNRALSEREAGETYRFFARRYNSSTPQLRMIAFGSLGLFTLVVATGFALLGAWPVAPFAGIECAALFLVYRWLRRHDGDSESVMVNGDHVIIDSRFGGHVVRNEMNRFWVHVVLDGDSKGRTRLLLRSHGREVEIGKLLPDTAKSSLAKQLRTRISGLV